jgi:Ulp1 family protease
MVPYLFYKSCPEQLNGFDCGIIAVAVCLHLSERKPVDQTSSAQSDATEDRRLLSDCLGVHAVDKDNTTSSRYFRAAFPIFQEHL